MKLIARKPCSFDGKKFYIGDEVPGSLVLNPAEQEKMGVLAIVNDGQASEADLSPAPADTVGLDIAADEGILHLEVTTEGLQDVVNVLAGKSADASEVIESMSDNDALILLHMCDSRKAVKAAAEARAKELNESEAKGGEQ